MLKKYTFILWIFSSLLWYSCSEDESYTPVEEPEVSPVVFDIANVPYETLSEYNFFEGEMADISPVYGVLPYTLINTLFTDYAKKKRFVWMPSDVKATYESDEVPLNFPIGTVLIKNFYYENVLPSNSTKNLETRLMIRKEEGWVFANYVWNEDQTEAILDLEGSFIEFDWVEDGVTKTVDYRIPAGPECRTCHKKSEIPFPVGPKPRNLNRTFNYDDGNLNQLSKMIEMNYLEDNLPANIGTMAYWKDTSESLTDRVRAYVEINCAHCHSDDSHCSYRPMRFAYEESSDPVNLGVCVEPDTDLGEGHSHIVVPNNIQRSIISYRLESTDESVRMPLLGRTIVHDEGLALINEWINSLTEECED